ncbi:hypothetical protein P280DRAFT_195750 [Massarina eburnea CBS 473.64]|uniref:Uncharacterized protein n=1 Tax=Massarina eburnea CBS 473.64 TaxID=1395130 RepID=A0A6A6RJP1_9PLEO|nr:hypothetical protein P280DRAFT_195750 [Massarina eburnea CBS 473.64]
MCAWRAPRSRQRVHTILLFYGVCAEKKKVIIYYRNSNTPLDSHTGQKSGQHDTVIFYVETPEKHGIMTTVYCASHTNGMPLCR